ncbi:unnamed protein product [Closterium sp. NIES-64]|nr:unnamed protein product [Closterium sp. NIES-64]
MERVYTRKGGAPTCGTPPATIGGPGSPWELPSSAEVTQTRGHGETTRRDHAEQEEDAAEQTEPTAARHQHLRSPSPQAAAALNAPGIQRDCGAGAQREGRREQREELMVTPTPHASDEAPSPRHQAYPEDGAPLRTALDALFRRDCPPPVAHDAHAHLRSSAQATAGEMGPADAGGQENGPRDEGSRAVGTLQEGANAELGADAQTSGGQATAGEMNGEGANDDDANGGHGIGFATPRDEVTVANGPHHDDHRGGSAAYRRELPMSDGEANAPGAPQPLRRSARRTPRAGAPAVTRTCPRAEPTRATGPRSGGGSDQRTLAKQQARSRQGVQEEADGEQDRSPRCSRGQERQGNPLANAQDAPLAHEEPTTPMSQAQQAEPVAATPWSGRRSTRGRGGRRGARGGQRSAGQAGRGPPCQLPSPIWLGEPAERVTRQSFARRGARGGTPAQAGRNRDINTEGSGDDYVPSDLRQPDDPASPHAEQGASAATGERNRPQTASQGSASPGPGTIGVLAGLAGGSFPDRDDLGPYTPNLHHPPTNRPPTAAADPQRLLHMYAGCPTSDLQAA